MPIPDDFYDGQPSPLWSGTDWTKPAHSNPVEDLRLGSAAIFLNRPLTAFERIIVAQGLADSETIEGFYRHPHGLDSDA